MKRIWPLILLVAIALGIGAYIFNQQLQPRTADGVSQSNGRLQLERVDVATLYAGRVERVMVSEGQQVARDQALVKLASDQYDSQLTAARGQHQQALRAVAQAEAEVKAMQEQLRLAEIERDNAAALHRDRLVAATELQKRQVAVAAREAAVEAAQQGQAQAQAAVTQAQAQLEAAQSAHDDLLIRAPLDGVVEYQFAHPGNVVGAGYPVVSLFDPSDVSMVVFFPIETIAQIGLGDEARIRLDGQAYVWPATIRFISGQAQFTPKTVETAQERQKLMYRVELRIPPEVSVAHQRYLKSGLSGMGYVKTAEAQWPAELAVELP